ncbi:MAG TPA: hypothetical protein VHE61_07285 [Opitutaceae bacterium]|nr:hypothetical protein [Opitutaceae bacterium]
MTFALPIFFGIAGLAIVGYLGLRHLPLVFWLWTRGTRRLSGGLREPGAPVLRRKRVTFEDRPAAVALGDPGNHKPALFAAAITAS